MELGGQWVRKSRTKDGQKRTIEESRNRELSGWYILSPDSTSMSMLASEKEVSRVDLESALTAISFSGAKSFEV